MKPAILFEADDRCSRSSYLISDWERERLATAAALYQGVETGLTYDEGDEDPGQIAGDHLYTLAAERGLETTQKDLYGQAQHLSAIADITTFFLRTGKAWERPEDIQVGSDITWESTAFLEPSGTRLKRVILTDWWGPDRAIAEEHSWRTFGEATAYDLPMIQTVVVLGSHRDGRRHGPFSKAWTHPINNALRMRKRSGEKFGGQWRQVWREDTEYSRELWIDQMTADGIIGDVVMEVEVPPPTGLARLKILDLIQRKMEAIRNTKEVPAPQPSACRGISVCQFESACWKFVLPNMSNGFIRITDGNLPR